MAAPSPWRRRWTPRLVALAGLAVVLCCAVYFLAGLRRKPAPADCFAPPVEPFVVVQPFGAADDSGEVHLGVDLAQPAGAPVVSVAGGYVAFAGEVEGYGALVVLEHTLADGQTVLSIYGGLDPAHLLPRAGQMVERGQPLGRVVARTREPGPQEPRLHLGFRRGAFERRWNVYGWGPPSIAGDYLEPTHFLQEHACPGVGE